MKKLVFCLFFIISFVLYGKEYKLFFLGGQSNMQGFGMVNELPEDIGESYKSVMIFHGNWTDDDQPVDGRGIWTQMRPGFGYGAHSDGVENTYSDKFGPELGFSMKITELLPEDNIAILKYAKGGSSIAIGGSPYGTWDPDYSDSTGINQYDHFLAAVNNALAIKDIDGDGEDDKLVPAGILWMQGESDADKNEEQARAYRYNLKRLMDLIRATFRVDDLPVVIGQIADSGNDKTDGKMMNYIELVWEAQLNFVNNDPAAAIVSSTLRYDFMDNWHYNTAGQLDLGKNFAVKIVDLLKK